MKNLNDELLINLYVNENNLTAESQKNIEKFLAESIELNEFHNEKKQAKDYLLDLTPRLRPSKKIEKDLLLEISDINSKVFDIKEDSFIVKSLKFLDKPLFTLKF